MPLFTDGLVSGLEELTAQDTQLSNVANVEGIDVTQKLALAQEELALEITTLLGGSRRAEEAFWLNARPTIDNVVATPALKLWHTFRALEMVYGDAYSSQLNDRYAAKRDQFHERSRWAYERLLLMGIGIAWSPVPRAKQPQAVSAAGSLPNGTYYVAMTWVNGKSEEGAPSVPATITTAESTLLVEPAAPPACATGWNVYIGSDPDALWRQNASPIAVSQTWLQPNAIADTGSGPGWGQSPNCLMPMPRVILRG
jgi:hypothetical protein